MKIFLLFFVKIIFLYYRRSFSYDNSEKKIIKETISSLYKIRNKVFKIKRGCLKYFIEAKTKLNDGSDNNPNPLSNILMAYYNKKLKERNSFVIGNTLSNNPNTFQNSNNNNN